MDYYIVFAGIIDQNFSTRLFSAITNAINISATRIVLFLSSLGGDINEGFLLASIIQNCKIPVTIHATNNIDSIANVIYLSAKERTAESYAKFYFHGASTSGIFDEKALQDRLQAVKTDSMRIAYFISENTNLSLQRVRAMMSTGSSITAQEALQCGIVNAVIHKEVPRGAMQEEIIAIN